MSKNYAKPNITGEVLREKFGDFIKSDTHELLRNGGYGVYVPENTETRGRKAGSHSLYYAPRPETQDDRDQREKAKKWKKERELRETVTRDELQKKKDENIWGLPILIGSFRETRSLPNAPKAKKWTAGAKNVRKF